MSDADDRRRARGRAAGPQLPDVLQDALRRLVAEGRERLVRAADDGRSLLRLRGLQRDRDALWARLGKEAYLLQQSGEIDHPAFRRAIERIGAPEAEIAALQAQIEQDGATR
jgi:hypothetical protein